MLTYQTLQNLQNKCFELMVATNGLQPKGDDTAADDSRTRLDDKTFANYNRRLLQATRKIVIANEFREKMIICVTGLQGAGKTTLVKNFFDIPDDILNISLGRGETMPVFICEKKIALWRGCTCIVLWRKPAVNMKKGLSRWIGTSL